ncbi:hypothetical protein KY285_007622 [Solanum tuberosum]|nr:hypothetical protein KY285_007622 [Solanum tuberosum]
MPEDQPTASMAAPATSALDHYHPFYLQASDSLGLVINPIKLTGPDNYSLWSRSMKLALQGKESNLYVDNLKSQRLLQFLMGLNESYCSPRTGILSRNANVTVNEAYAIMTQEEGKISLGVVDVHKDPLTMLAGRTQGYRPKKQGNSGGSIGAIGGGIPCIHCGYKVHLKDYCYRVVGYPQDFKSRRKSSQQAHQTPLAQFKPIANSSSNTKPNNLQSSRPYHPSHGSGYFLTEQQYQELLGKQDHPTTSSECVSNMAVSKITKDLSCVVLFFHDFCVFHGLYNGKVLGIGREKEGLYLLREKITPTINVASLKPYAEVRVRVLDRKGEKRRKRRSSKVSSKIVVDIVGGDPY